MTAVDDLIAEVQSTTVSLNPQPIDARVSTFIAALQYLMSGGGGGVSSVGLSAPAQFTVSGSPVTGIGTLAFSWANQAANVFLAGPTSGGATTPAFRGLVPADLPIATAAALGAVRVDGTTITITGGGIISAVGSGSGTVTSVGLAAPAELTVTGSPVATAGTLTLTWANESANLILAGPTTGAAATPGFRALVPADLPVATGAAFGAVKPDGTSITIAAGILSAAATVSSVGLTAPAQFTVSGSPVTGAGTLALTWANQTANFMLCGPASGAAAVPTFRALTPADLVQSIGTVASGATITPTNVGQYEVTALAVPATIAIPSGTPVDGQKLIIRIKDNGTARALTWTTSAGGYRVITGITLPTATTGTAIPNYIGCIWNSQDSFWDVVAAQ